MLLKNARHSEKNWQNNIIGIPKGVLFYWKFSSFILLGFIKGILNNCAVFFLTVKYEFHKIFFIKAKLYKKTFFKHAILNIVSKD